MAAEEGAVAAPVVAGAVVPAPGAAEEEVVEVAAAPVVAGAEEAVAGEGAVVASGVAGEVAAPVW
ncbi:hypothetical protein [Streptomyces microflavus]|uniref:hypothetical protein n=1 Tax=Streptomyces microflavus TaxID=1919 RepID=UPI0013E00B4E|nr:hypothetical protein [Streptomyces microflavus]